MYLSFRAVCALLPIAAMATTSLADNSQQGTGGVTVTMRVPFALDHTDLIAARDRLVPPPTGIFIVPNQIGAFQGRTGPRFHSSPDPVDTFLAGPGRFPGPSENGLTPGDPNMCVGPTHVLSVINGRITIHTKAGVSKLDVAPQSFFTGMGLSFGLIFDPRCWYDQYSGRFWFIYSAFDASANRTYCLIALSDDNNPEGVWAKWATNTTLDGAVDNGCWMDYPGFGGNQDVVMVTGNMYPFSTGSFYSKIRSLPKAQFLSGNPVLTYTDFVSYSNSALSGKASLQPARHLGTNNMPYVATVGGSSVSILGIQNPLSGSPTLVSKSASTPGYGGSGGGDQKDTTVKVDTLDTRIYDVCCRDNKVVLSHNVSGGGGSRVRWYHMNASNMPSSVSLIQSGTIEDPAADCYYTAPQINGSGAIGMAFTRSSATEYVSLYYTGQPPGWPSGTVLTPVLKKGGTRAYTGEGGTTVRWGDYMGGAVDPADDTTFWAIGMLPHSSNGGAWVTEVYSYVISGSPPTETTYQAQSVTVTAGTNTGGAYTALHADDNSNFDVLTGVVLHYAIGEASFDVQGVGFYAEFDVGTSPKTGGNLDLRAWSNVNARLDVQVYNYSMNRWDYAILNNTVGVAEQYYTAAFPGTVTAYISAAHKVRVRATTQGPFTHTFHADQLQVRMTGF